MFFELRWGDVDSEMHFLFIHETKTQDEWEKDCIQAVKNCVDDYLKTTEFYASLDPLVTFSVDELEKMGYVLIRPNCFIWEGGYSLERADDYRNDYKELEKRIGKKNLKKITDFNKRKRGRERI